MRGSRQRRWAHATRASLIAAFVCACSQRGDPRAELRRPEDLPERPTGCIDTPHIAGNPGAPTPGIRCGRSRSPDAGLIHGHVTAQFAGGLPGPGVEGLRISIHPIEEGPLRLEALPPPRSETVTGPQGDFSLSMVGRGEFVIVVRAEAGGPILAARLLGTDEDRGVPLTLVVPAP